MNDLDRKRLDDHETRLTELEELIEQLQYGPLFRKLQRVREWLHVRKAAEEIVASEPALGGMPRLRR